nr:MAG TPA: DNA pilot protein VP2 [Microviridae sp.]
MDPIVTSALIGAGASAVAGAGSAIASGKMNRRAVKYNKWALQEQQRFNAEQAQLGRDWQEQMIAQQNDYNLAQWNRENEYNSPAAQRARLEGAGLNAALMMQGQGSIGQAQAGRSAAAPVGAPTATSGLSSAPQFHKPDFALFSQAVDSFFKNKLVDTQATSQGLDNLLKARYGDTLSQLSIGKSSAEIDNLRAMSARNYADTALASLKADEQRTLNKYLSPAQQLSLITKMAEYTSITEGTKLKFAQYRTEVARELQIRAEAEGKKISNQVARKTADGLIEAMNSENRFRAYDNALGYGYLPRRHYLNAQLLEGDYGMQKVQRALAEFEEYVRNTKGNRWIKKNLKPVTDLVFPAATGAVAVSKFR